jgi:uncharacterized protein YjbI with pentapeptide repeats
MVWEITAEELLARYADGERNFAGIELIQSAEEPQDNMIDLRGAILPNINLRGAYLRQADLTQADLTGADLFGVSLELAWLNSAIIRDANLYSANLSWCDLTEADLRGTDLNHMNASFAKFCGANMGGFSYAILPHANFRSADVSQINICRFGNLIWETTMPDGSVERGPYWKWE